MFTMESANTFFFISPSTSSSGTHCTRQKQEKNKWKWRTWMDSLPGVMSTTQISKLEVDSNKIPFHFHFSLFAFVCFHMTVVRRLWYVHLSSDWNGGKLSSVTSYWLVEVERNDIENEINEIELQRSEYVQYFSVPTQNIIIHWFIRTQPDIIKFTVILCDKNTRVQLRQFNETKNEEHKINCITL